MNDLKKLELQEKEFRKKINLLETLVNIKNKRLFKKKSSTYDNMLLLFQEVIFMQMIRKEMPDMEQEMAGYCEEKVVVEVCKEDTGYHQMILPGLEKIMQQPIWKKEKVSLDMFMEHGCFIKDQRRMKQSDMLLLHDKHTLTDFHKYVMLSEPKRETNKTLAEKLSSYILENPLHILPALSCSAIKTFLSFDDLHEQEKVIIGEENVDDYMSLLVWGFLSIEMKRKEGKLYFALAMPKEVQQIVVPVFSKIESEGMKGVEIAGYLEESHVYTLKTLYECYDKILGQIRKILTVYGAMEIEEFYHTFTELLYEKCEKEDFLHFLYLKGTFRQEIATGQNWYTKQKIVGLQPDVIEQILENEQPKVTCYYKYQSYEKLEHCLKNSLALWDKLYHVLNQWDMSEGELKDCMNKYIQILACGKGMYELFDYIGFDFDIEYAVDIAAVWRELVILCVQYPCYVLKGYNRLQAEQEFGLERYFDMFEVEQSDNIAAKSMIYELPKEFQQQLADMVLLSEQGLFEQLIVQEEKIEEKYRTNPAVSAVLVMNLVAAYTHVSSKEQQKKWVNEVKHRVQLWCNNIKDSEERRSMLAWCEKKNLFFDFDKKVSKKRMQEKKMIESYFWGDGESKSMPVIKGKKIYPNEPCPCGSGKKYKKCCGRNR